MTTITKGLNQSEYETIKAAAKKELNFRVNIRRHTNTPSTYGSIDIRPTATNQRNGYKHTWTEDQTLAVYEFAKRHNLHIAMAYSVPMQNVPYVYQRGFSYLRLIVG